MDKLVCVKINFLNKEASGEGEIFFHEFLPEIPFVREIRGRAWLLINLGGGREGFNPSVLAENLISAFNKNYFQNQTGSVYRALRQAVETLSHELSGFFEADYLPPLAAAVLWGNILYLCRRGEAGAIVLRNGKPRSIFPPREKTSAEAEIASGYVGDGDIVVISTTNQDTGKMTKAANIPSGEETADSLDDFLILKFSLSPVPSVEEESILIARISERIKEKTRFDGLKDFLPKIKINFTLPKIALPKELFSPFPVIKRSEEEKKKRQVISLAVFLLVIFSVSVFLGIVKRRAEEEKAANTGIVQEARENFEQGKQLLEINPAMARKYLFMAQEKISEAKAKGKKKNNDIEALATEINASLERALKIVRLGQPTEFYNFGLIKKQATAVSLSLFDDILYFLSSEGEVFSVSAKNKSAKILSGKQEETGSLAAISSGVYFLQGKNLMTIKPQTESPRVSVHDNSIWGEIAAGAGFSDNLYLLDRQNNKIWKYVFGIAPSVRSYIAETEAVNFDSAVSLSVDGFVWVLFSDGRIEKFAGRVKDVFSFSGLDQPLSSPRKIYSDENTTYLYILDSGNSRIVLFDKEGAYFSQYQAPAFGKATDFVVDEKGKRMYVLDREKVYLIDLK
ncbi:MAG: hypothetical protein Q8N98_04695 [bacterium]|nr:hypothetical protein [bacterium]